MRLLTIWIDCVVPENIHTPPTEGFSSLTPPPPRIFRSRGSRRTPPTPRKFHVLSFGPPYPLESSYLQNKNKNRVIYVYFITLDCNYD